MTTTYAMIPPSDATWARLAAPYGALDVAALHEIELQFANGKPVRTMIAQASDTVVSLGSNER